MLILWRVNNNNNNNLFIYIPQLIYIAMRLTYKNQFVVKYKLKKCVFNEVSKEFCIARKLEGKEFHSLQAYILKAESAARL
jgi:hypothetical protein